MRQTRGNSEPPAPPTDSLDLSGYHERSGLRRLQVPFKIAGISMGSQGSLNSSGCDDDHEDFIDVARSLRQSRKQFQKENNNNNNNNLDAFAAPFGTAGGGGYNPGGKTAYQRRPHMFRSSSRKRRASSVTSIAAKFESLTSGEGSAFVGSSMSVGSSSASIGSNLDNAMGFASDNDAAMSSTAAPNSKHITVKIKCRRVRRGSSAADVSKKSESPFLDSVMDGSEAEIAKAFMNDDNDEGMETGDEGESGAVVAMDDVEENNNNSKYAHTQNENENVLFTTTVCTEGDMMVWDQSGNGLLNNEMEWEEPHCPKEVAVEEDSDFVEVNPEDVHYHYKPRAEDAVKNQSITEDDEEEPFVLIENQPPKKDDEEEDEEEEANCPAFDALFVKTIVEDEDEDQFAHNVRGGTEEGMPVVDKTTPITNQSEHDRIFDNEDEFLFQPTLDMDLETDAPNYSNLETPLKTAATPARQDSALSNYSDETFVTCLQEAVEQQETVEQQVLNAQTEAETGTTAVGVNYISVLNDQALESNSFNGSFQMEKDSISRNTYDKQSTGDAQEKVSVQERVEFWKGAFASDGVESAGSKSGTQLMSKRKRNLTIDYHDLNSSSLSSSGKGSSTWSWNGQVARYVQKSYSPSVAASVVGDAADGSGANAENIEEGVGHGLGIILDRLRSIETKLDEIKNMDQNVYCPEVESVMGTGVVKAITKVMPEVGETPTNYIMKEGGEDDNVENDLPPAPSTSPSFDGEEPSEQGEEGEEKEKEEEEEEDTLTDDDVDKTSEDGGGESSSQDDEREIVINPHVSVSLPASDDETEEKSDDADTVKVEIMTEDQRMARIEEIAARILMEKKMLAKYEEIDKGLDTLSERSEEDNDDAERIPNKKTIRERRLSRRTRSSSRDRASSLAKIRYCWRCHQTGHESFDCRKEVKPGNWCPRCLDNSHWENECWVNDKQVRS